jgi:large subunit ribosomal protein L6
VTVKGPKGTLSWTVHRTVEIESADGLLRFAPANDDPSHWAMAGTTRALLNNMVTGVSTGFERRLTLVGVGYRAQAKGKVLNLALGFSHRDRDTVADRDRGQGRRQTTGGPDGSGDSRISAAGAL